MKINLLTALVILRIKKVESEEHKQLNEFSICSNITYWAEKSLEANIIQNNYTIDSIIEFFKELEEKTYFKMLVMAMMIRLH
jgi:hypothetical protein